MTIKTSVTNTQRVGSVLVTQSSLLADTPDDDITTVVVSRAKTLKSFEVVNGSASDIYFKIFDGTTVTIGSDVPIVMVKITTGTTQFVGSSLGVVFGSALSVVASTSSAPSNNATAYTGTVSYTIIAGT
jgi:hypothetical protein